jgi:hypothetical protein
MSTFQTIMTILAGAIILSGITTAATAAYAIYTHRDRLYRQRLREFQEEDRKAADEIERVRKSINHE